MGPIHDLRFAIQCHHATRYWLAQAQFEAPFVTVRSGQPYDVPVGKDIYGDTLSNARAVFASANTWSNVVRSSTTVCSPFGTFGTTYNAANPGNLVPRNYLTMPGLPIVPLLV